MYINCAYAITKRITIISALLLLLLACYAEQSIASGEKGEDTVVAVVNGVDIKESKLDALVAKYKKQAKKDEISPDEKVTLVKNLIRRVLILQSDAVRTLRNDPEVVKVLKQIEDGLVIKRYLETQMRDKLAVSDAAIKAFYDKNIHKYETPPMVAARHILLRSSEEAEKTLADLKNGADFKQLAKERSIDLPMALEGGEMGTIARGKCLPELESTLFTLNPGDFSEIIKTKYGYHILSVDIKIPASFEPFKKVEKEIKKHLMKQKEKKAFDELASALEKGADIKIYTERFSNTE